MTIRGERSMIESIKVKNYRAFPQFAVENLGRINLLVGKNNSGKTSLLEAIQIAASGVDQQVLWEIAVRRGESFVDDPEPPYRRQSEIDISHWFHGFGFESGAELRIALLNKVASQYCEISVAESADVQRRLFRSDGSGAVVSPQPGLPDSSEAESELYAAPAAALRIVSSESKFARMLSLTGRGGLLVERSAKSTLNTQSGNVVFVPTAGIATSQLVAMVDDLALTDDEGIALRAMQSLDNRIERFAAKGRDSRARIMIRSRNVSKPLPIGSLGDGVNRLLTIAVAIAKSSGGVLLVDEIDTGLHYTALERMWKFVNDAAIALNVQVFATTHSRDCFESLSAVCENREDFQSSVSIQRVDSNGIAAVSYSKDELVAAAQRGLEVR